MAEFPAQWVRDIAERLRQVKSRIGSACQQAGRAPASVKLVVVTKTASLESIKQVIRLGCTELGENHVQQLRKVSAEINEFLRQQDLQTTSVQQVSWHMIGHLQRNKVKHVLPIASLIHSVDTLRLAEEIDATGAKLGLNPRVLLQVNSSREASKYGVAVGAVTHLAEQIQTLAHLKLVGLMTMGPLTLNKELVRACFARTKELFDEMRGEKIVGPEFTELSMGMSQDYEIAIEQGATILRIGSAIFGG
jgi:hypothetical protein